MIGPAAAGPRENLRSYSPLFSLPSMGCNGICPARAMVPDDGAPQLRVDVRRRRLPENYVGVRDTIPPCTGSGMFLHRRFIGWTENNVVEAHGYVTGQGQFGLLLLRTASVPVAQQSLVAVLYRRQPAVRL